MTSATYFGIPSFVLYCIAGILALREKQTFFTSDSQKGTNRKEYSQTVEGLNHGGRKNNAS